MQKAREVAQYHVWFQHHDADGFITMAKKDKETGRFKQYHYRAPELAENLSKWMGDDVFFSQNTFYKPQRTIENIRQLKSLYVDLDCYLFNYDPDWILGKLELEYFNEAIPEPNIILFSGQGLVLIWLLEPVPYKALPLWQAIQNYMIRELKSLGGDSKAADAARVFRLPGTTSSKNGNQVKAIYRHDHHYELRQIQHDYLPELTPKKAKTPGRKKKVLHLFNIYTLHHARLQDLRKLIQLREGDMEGIREITCFLYRYWNCCYLEDHIAAEELTIELNDSFTKPLPLKEVIKATKSAEKAWQAKSSKEADEIAKAKGYPGAGYNISNKKLIEWLDISPQEQEHMKTIIGPQEKKRRNTIAKKEARRQAGMRPMEEYNQVRRSQKEEVIAQAVAIYLDNPQISNRKLAAMIGKSESYIRKYKQEILKAISKQT